MKVKSAWYGVGKDHVYFVVRGFVVERVGMTPAMDEMGTSEVMDIMRVLENLVIYFWNELIC